jgi:aryl-alcohol dehydrogenase-like predicted oxidoreductase
MEYRQLGRSGLRVSVLTLGTMAFGRTGSPRIGAVDLAGARRQIDLALDAGVNLFDTADVYGSGASEETVGRVIAGRRDRLLLATKARMRMGEGQNDTGLSRYHLIRSCEASLRRLGTDHIDLYQVHEWDGQTPLEETLEALDTLVRTGKVRYIGSSNYAGWQLVKALATSDRLGYQRFISQQIYYTLQARDAEYELIPAGIDQGVSVLVWSPLAGGLLSGKYRRGQPAPEGARHFGGWTEPPVHDETKLYDTIEVIVEIAAAHEISASQVALAWLLGRPAVGSLVIGARNEEQLTDNLRSVDLQLSTDDRARLDAVSAPTLLYPYWHQAEGGADRLGAADLSLLAPFLKG